MTLNARQLELLKDVYEHYIRSNEFPDRQAFRDSHNPEDLEHLNKLEYNFNYLKGDDVGSQAAPEAPKEV